MDSLFGFRKALSETLADLTFCDNQDVSKFLESTREGVAKGVSMWGLIYQGSVFTNTENSQ